ncbi:hypothetical protein [Nonomuraea salmonea]|uniref:hypothetical protein n=1 Tax=Nonomuraea salmonea TaxID=46181 RepID=UPI0031EC0CBC
MVLAHAAAASLTAFVSASPEEAIRTCSSAGPPLCCRGAACRSSKPLPQAVADRSTAAATGITSLFMDGGPSG